MKETIAQLIFSIYYEHYRHLPEEDRLRLSTFKFRENLTRLGIDIPKLENMPVPRTKVNEKREG